MKKKPIIAAFDFDGTLTKKDSLLPFLTFMFGKATTAKKLILLSPTLVGFLFNIVSRQQTKEAILKSFFKDFSYPLLKTTGKAFAKSSELKRLLRPEAIQRLKWHQNQKHRCILISASLSLYLEPWSKLYGFDDLICSALDVDKNHIVSGALKGLNCWGPEKTRLLIKKIGSKNHFILYAYGDSRGDQELLSMANYPFYKKMPSSAK